MTSTLHVCSPKFSLMFMEKEYDHNHDSILVNQVYISGYSEMCCEYHAAIKIQLKTLLACMLNYVTYNFMTWIKRH